MASPRLMALSQPKKVEDPSTNPYRLQNVALNSPKPLWRSTRPLEGANGLPAVYKRSETKDYHEARFGWRSGFWTMWDTEPNGTKNAIRVAPDEIQQNVAFHQIRDRPHDDPCRMQLFPTAHTSSARLGSAHEAWDARSSKAWQDIIAKEKSSASTARRSTARPSTVPTQGPVLPGKATAHTGRLAALAVPGHRPLPMPPKQRPRSVRGRFPHRRAWTPGSTSPRSKQFGAYVPSAVH